MAYGFAIVHHVFCILNNRFLPLSYGFFLAFHSFMFGIRWLRLHVKSLLIGYARVFCSIRFYPKMLGFRGLSFNHSCVLELRN